MSISLQAVEQRQYRPSRSRKSARKSLPPSSADAVACASSDPDMPEHDLEPPRFARKALERLLGDWKAVRAMVLTGAAFAGKGESGGDAEQQQSSTTVYEQQAFLNGQKGTCLLDKFSHCLLTKCSSEMLDTLLTTLIKQLQGASGDPEAVSEAKLVIKRFVRSVTRVFVVFNIELSPTQSKKKSLQHSTQPLQRCKRAFQALITVAIEELCETANALLAPVR